MQQALDVSSNITFRRRSESTDYSLSHGNPKPNRSLLRSLQLTAVPSSKLSDPHTRETRLVA